MFQTNLSENDKGLSISWQIWEVRFFSLFHMLLEFTYVTERVKGIQLWDPIL